MTYALRSDHARCATFLTPPVVGYLCLGICPLRALVTPDEAASQALPQRNSLLEGSRCPVSYLPQQSAGMRLEISRGTIALTDNDRRVALE